ncbi:peptidoglycan-binding protein [Streptomyces sp. NPDC060232]|uniref:peptidoglycan-binding domain-containing protein n=1 Tax=Streptomyces sp. NPDC060232 TaxID=3347079 RepID=UPI00365F5B4B
MPAPQQAAEAAAEDDTPAYGIPVAPSAGPRQDGPWQAGPAYAPHPAETIQLRTVPAAGPASGPAFGGERQGGGGGGGPEGRSGSASRRRPLALLIGAAATVALSGTAVAVWVLPASTDSDTALLDAKASAPAVSAAPVAPSGSPSRASASPSASKSPTASKSPSASPSPSRSASSAPPSPSASRSASRSSSPPPAQAPVLRYGDSGPEVEKLQRLLAAQELYRGRFHGKFDWRVEDALLDFQYDRGIDPQEWGVYGPLTRKALEG